MVSAVAETVAETEAEQVAETESRRARFRTLPRHIPLKDTFASQAPDAAPDPTMGRDPDRDFMLRNAGMG